MHIEQLKITNFRCFGPDTVVIEFARNLTTFIGANGSGKTAMMQALQRLFGVTSEQRRIRRQDFHVPLAEISGAKQRSFVIEAILAFPELDDEGADDSAVPEFFQQMAATGSGQLRCRLRLQATWTDDSSLDGVIEQRFFAVRTLGAFEDADCSDLKATDRSRIQLVYIPATRDGTSQLTAFLRGRLWRAVNWSQKVRDSFEEAATRLNEALIEETAVNLVAEQVTKRWRQVHTAGTDAMPQFRTVDTRFPEFIRKIEVVFHPDEAGRDRALDDLSDGQRSLFHLAMNAAILDIEGRVSADAEAVGFTLDGVSLPSLTLVAVEEPENNLAPFYLSRIVLQLEELTTAHRAQAILSSHSPSILARIDPLNIRHFRLDQASRASRVKSISLPQGSEEASKFVREAVRAYPELYFARFVVLGEGASEEVVLPRLAESMHLPVDRSFVAVIPLGGRHVNHLWRLLSDLEISYATLLDLDVGRAGGGWGRIKNALSQLLAIGVKADQLFDASGAADPEAALSNFDVRPYDPASMRQWIAHLRQFKVFFCEPLDLDYSMLLAFPDAYQTVEVGARGPSKAGDPRESVLGVDGVPGLYESSHDENLRWYRYLFLGRGKPSTHVRVLSGLNADALAKNAPKELRALLDCVVREVEPRSPGGVC